MNKELKEKILKMYPIDGFSEVTKDELMTVMDYVYSCGKEEAFKEALEIIRNKK